MKDRTWLRFTVCVALMAAAIAGCGKKNGSQQESAAPIAADTSRTLVLYSGRSEGLVEPVIALFEKETSIDVQVKYGNTPELALTLREEGTRGRADVFWAQDAGALGAVSKAGLFVDLPADVGADSPAHLPPCERQLGRHQRAGTGARLFTGSRDGGIAAQECVRPQSTPAFAGVLRGLRATRPSSPS